MAKKTAAPAALEEKMKAALVPAEEQPYAVPENWCWVRFGNLATEMADGPFGSNLKTEHYTSKKEVRIIQLSNIGDEGWREENTKYTTFHHAETIARSIVQPGNLVIAKMMPAGRAIICPSGEAMYILSSDAVKVVPHQELLNRFLCYSINSFYFRNLVQENTQGITRARTSIKKLKLYPFALPPLAEQRRIVDHIETMFAKLDEAKEKAQAVIDGYEDQKAAILHKAFTGELTVQWRIANSLTMDSWQTEVLSSRFDITGGIQKTPARVPKDNPVPYITVANVYRNYLDLSEIRYFEVTNEEISRLRLYDRDILIVEGNGSGNEIGRCAMWHNELPLCIHQNHIIRARATNENTFPEYVLYYMNSPSGNRIIREKAVTTAGLYNLSVGKIKSIPAPFPTLPEQREIVRILDDFLAKEAAVKEAAETTLATIDTMKQSILSRAFRGELGTNDPNDEPAQELLKRILNTAER